MEVPRNPKPSKIIGRLILIAVLVVVSCSREVVGRRGHNGWRSFDYSAISCRRYTASLTDFGGVGDGVTLNTDAFRTAVDFLSGFAPEGGSMLYVPPGKWLTGSFNLTSHFTLFLDQDAVILASQVVEIADYMVGQGVCPYVVVGLLVEADHSGPHILD
nr:probable polygalacturonase [Ipomoea batatas]